MAIWLDNNTGEFTGDGKHISTLYYDNGTVIVRGSAE